MLIESNRWIRNGIAISFESVKLLFRNPILFVYTLAPVLTVILSYLFMGTTNLFIQQNFVTAEFETYSNAQLATYGIWSIIITFFGIFFSCCLARHTMHILRQQPTSVSESCRWVLQHYKQIVAWILVVIVSSLSWLTLFPPSMYAIVILGFFAISLFFLGFLSTIFLLFRIYIVTPIIATETIAIIPAIKRSSQIIWNHLGTYIVSLLASSIITALVYAVLAIIISFLIGPEYTIIWKSYLNSELIFILALPIIITIANTIFYYEFYVKRELELQEIMFTSQI
jgi:hypothetical protein